MALLGGPKRYFELKQLLTRAGTNILSDRLRGLAANGLVTRITGDAPGSETRYQLTPRGAQLAPVIGGLATWGVELLTATTPGSDIIEKKVFDRGWTVEAATEQLKETYQWSVEGAEFELAVHGDRLIRRPGPATNPAVIMTASNAALADLVTGRRSLEEVIKDGQIRLEGAKAAIRRMFSVVGFPLLRMEP